MLPLILLYVVKPLVSHNPCLPLPRLAWLAGELPTISSQTLYMICHTHTTCRVGLPGSAVRVRAMVGLDPGLLWAETSFDESRQSLSLLISNFEEIANTRLGESTASAPRQEPRPSAPPSGVGDEDDKLSYSLYSSCNPCSFAWLGWNRAMIV